MVKKNKGFDLTTDTLIIAGGLNWLFVPFNLNLVESLANIVGIPILENIVYIGVGVSAIYKLYTKFI